MKGIVKAIIAGVVIIIIGVIILVVALAVNGWSFKSPSFEIQTYTAEKEFSRLEISIGEGSLRTEYYDGERIVIEHPVSSVFRTTVTETGDKLIYTAKRKSLISFGNWNIPDTVIKLPVGIYDMEIEMNAGSVTLADGEYGKLNIDIDAGSFGLNDIACESLNLEMSAGSFKAQNVDCNMFELDMKAGSANITKMTCPQISIDVSAGSANLGLACAKEEYSIFTDVSAGSCNVSRQTGTTDKKISVELSAGKVNIQFGV